MTIPQHLKKSLQNKAIIPFVGAGVSMSVKNKANGNPLFPSWKNLLKQASLYLEEENKGLDATHVNVLVDKNRLLNAAKEAKEALNSNWYEFLKQQFDLNLEDADPSSLELARRVWQLNSQLVITTNYDNVLHWVCPNNNLNKWNIEAPAEQYKSLRDGVSKHTIWHLHGTIDNSADIILTPEGYHKLYSEEKNEQKYQAALKTLQFLLSSKTFIFIGFSLEDESFVEQLRSLEEIFKGASGPHYVLLPDSLKSTFKSPVSCIEAVYFSGFGDPQLELLDELANIAKSTNGTKINSPPAPIKKSEQEVIDANQPADTSRFNSNDVKQNNESLVKTADANKIIKFTQGYNITAFNRRVNKEERNNWQEAIRTCIENANEFLFVTARSDLAPF